MTKTTSGFINSGFLEWQFLADHYRSCIEAVERGEPGAVQKLNEAFRRLKECQCEAEHRLSGIARNVAGSSTSNKDARGAPLPIEIEVPLSPRIWQVDASE